MKPTLSARTRFTALLLALPLAAGCADLLGNLPGTVEGVNMPPALQPPTVTLGAVTLAAAPSQQRLAAYYCPELVQVPFGGAGLLCQQLFGRRPAPAEMTVAFDLTFHVENPNQVPIPMASVLTAVTIFPAATNQRLGATCVQLCAEGQPGCGVTAPDACQASSRDVRSLNDFANAAANLIIANGVAAALGQPLTFTAPRVSAAAAMDVVVRFSFGPEPLLAALRQLASQSVGELRAGRAPSFSIPYRAEGTIFFDGGSFGRIAVGYGPLSGTWALPVEGILEHTAQ